MQFFKKLLFVCSLFLFFIFPVFGAENTEYLYSKVTDDEVKAEIYFDEDSQQVKFEYFFDGRTITEDNPARIKYISNLYLLNFFVGSDVNDVFRHITYEDRNPKADIVWKGTSKEYAVDEGKVSTSKFREGINYYTFCYGGNTTLMYDFEEVYLYRFFCTEIEEICLVPQEDDNSKYKVATESECSNHLEEKEKLEEETKKTEEQEELERQERAYKFFREVYILKKEEGGDVFDYEFKDIESLDTYIIELYESGLETKYEMLEKVKKHDHLYQIMSDDQIWEYVQIVIRKYNENLQAEEQAKSEEEKRQEEEKEDVEIFQKQQELEEKMEVKAEIACKGLMTYVMKKDEEKQVSTLDSIIKLLESYEGKLTKEKHLILLEKLLVKLKLEKLELLEG